MLEQEIASVMRFVLDSAGGPTPYYDEIPEGFLVPAVYFPPPEISSRSDTLSAYALEYTLYIKFIHNTTPEALALGNAAYFTLLRARNLIPLIDCDGNQTGRGLRTKYASLRKIDTGTFQFDLTWDSRRPYAEPDYQKFMTYDLGLYTREAYENAKAQTESEQEDFL